MWRKIKYYVQPKNSIIVSIICFFIAATLFMYGFSFVMGQLFGVHLKEDLYWTAVVGIGGFILTLYYRRQTRRHNAACNLEVALNYAHGALNDMILTLEDMIKKKTPIVMKTEDLIMNDEYMRIVGRLDVKNQLMNLICDFRKINHDWKVLCIYGDEYKNIILRQSGTVQEQQLTINIGMNLMSMLLNKCNEVQELIRNCMAHIRVYLTNDRPLFVDWWQPYIDKQNIEVLTLEELKQLEQEINES